jgi:hypothetical protein
VLEIPLGKLLIVGIVAVIVVAPKLWDVAGPVSPRR